MKKRLKGKEAPLPRTTSICAQSIPVQIRQQLAFKFSNDLQRFVAAGKHNFNAILNTLGRDWDGAAPNTVTLYPNLIQLI